MTRDAIIAMARDANPEHDLTAMLPFLSRFAALAAAREREECAQLAMEFSARGWRPCRRRCGRIHSRKGQAMSNHRHTTAAHGRFSFGRT